MTDNGLLDRNCYVLRRPVGDGRSDGDAGEGEGNTIVVFFAFEPLAAVHGVRNGIDVGKVVIHGLARIVLAVVQRIVDLEFFE